MAFARAIRVCSPALHEKPRGQGRAAQPLEAQPSQSGVSAAVTLERSQSRLGFNGTIIDAYDDSTGRRRRIVRRRFYGADTGA